MKAKEVKSGKDLRVYIKQCGAKIISDVTGEDFINRIVVVDKKCSDNRINIAFTDEVILWATHYWGGLSKSFRPGPLHVVHFVGNKMDNNEKICKEVWKMSRKRKRA